MSVDIEHTEEEIAALNAKSEKERRHCEVAADDYFHRSPDGRWTIADPASLAALLKHERSEAVIQELFKIIDEFNACKADRDMWKARAEAAEALAQRYAAQSAVMAAGQCDGANGIPLPGVYQFVRVGGPDSTSETCGRCGQHVSRHYGGTQYRCYSLRDDEQATEVFGGRGDIRAKLAAAEVERDALITSRAKVCDELLAAEARVADFEASKAGILGEVAGRLERGERAEAAAGQMRALLTSMRERRCSHVDAGAIDTVLATDAGRGWVSPEAWAQKVEECNGLLDAMKTNWGGARVVVDLPHGTSPSVALERISELERSRDFWREQCDVRERGLARVEAEAAAMRESLLSLKSYLGAAGQDADHVWIARNILPAALPAAGAAVARRLQALEVAVGAIRYGVARWEVQQLLVLTKHEADVVLARLDAGEGVNDWHDRYAKLEEIAHRFLTRGHSAGCVTSKPQIHTPCDCGFDQARAYFKEKT